MKRHFTLCWAVMGSIAVTSAAQPATPAAAPTNPPAATAPAATRPRQALVVPPGFKIVIVNRRSVVCQEGDEPWIRQALSEAKPATMPTTMPSDLLEKVSERRDLLADRISRDLGLADSTAARRLIDEQIIPMLRRASDFDPPVFYIVSTEPTIRRLIKDGWSNPLFYYNRAADRVAMNTTVQLSIAEPFDDTLLPALYEPEDDLPTRRRVLLDSIGQAEWRMANELAIRAEGATQREYLIFIAENAIKPLNLKLDQEWFGVGVSAVLSSKYLAISNGMPEDSLLRGLTSDDPRNRIRSATIDLLNPTPAGQMRQEARGAYLDAYSRKASAVVRTWIDRIQPGALAKTIAAIKTSAPADGPALVKVIAQQTGVDLTNELRPR